MVSNRSTTDDDYYYLVFDEENGDFSIEHYWHYWRHRGNKEGTENWSLAELKRKKPEIYKMAVELIETTIFAQREVE